MSVWKIALACVAASGLFLTGCGDDASKTTSAKLEKTAEAPLKAAWVYPSPRADEGWSKQHEEARELIKKKFGDRIQTQVVDNVTNTVDAERVIRDLAAQGNDIIFATSFTYMNPTLKVAREFPNVKFENCTGYKTADNYTNYNARFYEARYLAGKLAAAMSQTGNLGYVAALPVPEVLQGINAYTLGAQTVNPNVKVSVVWTNTWYDPGKEVDAANTLIGQGCDVLTHHTDSTAVPATAEVKGVKVISYHSAMTKTAPKYLIGAVTHHWDEYYERRIQALFDGKWKVEPVWGGADMHMVRLSAVTPQAPKAVVDDINAVYAKMEKGEFKVFAGPVVDNNGKEQIAAGKVADDKMLNTMNYFVKGVVGKVPASK